MPFGAASGPMEVEKPRAFAGKNAVGRLNDVVLLVLCGQEGMEV